MFAAFNNNQDVQDKQPIDWKNLMPFKIKTTDGKSIDQATDDDWYVLNFVELQEEYIKKYEEF